MLKISLFSSVLFLMASCIPSDGPDKNGGIQKVKHINLKWKNTSVDPLLPSNDVFLEVNGREEWVGSTQSCEKIRPHEFNDFSIPANAIDACGGWWAGGADYFYIEKNGNDEYWIYRAKVVETNLKNQFEYKPLLFINKSGHWNSIHNVGLIPGVYTKEGKSKSWTMVIEKQADAYTIGFAEIEGMLPPRTELPEVYLASNPILVERFDFNPFFLTFDSDLGKGYFRIEDKNVEITFEERLDESDSPLLMKKK